MDETNLSMLQTVKHDTMSRSLLLPQVIRTLKFPRSLQHLIAHRWTRVRLSRVSTLNHHFEHAGLCIHDQLDSREGSSENISPHFLLRRTHVLQGVRSAVDVPLRKNYQHECETGQEASGRTSVRPTKSHMKYTLFLLFAGVPNVCWRFGSIAEWSKRAFISFWLAVHMAAHLG